MESDDGLLALIDIILPWITILFVFDYILFINAIRNFVLLLPFRITMRFFIFPIFII